MTSHHPTPTPISGDAESETIRLNIPRLYTAYNRDGILHLMRPDGTVYARECYRWEKVLACASLLFWSLPHLVVLLRRRGREAYRGDSHTIILPPGTQGDAVADPLTNSEYSPLDGRTRSIAHSQRVAGWVRPRSGAELRGGGTDTDRFHVSYSQPALPCGLNGADKGEYSMEVRT